jgi:heme ABC exporter ATP-binding subunit CcmA
MALAVRFRSAVALIGNYPVLSGVDLQVERADVVLLRGPNGAGKTSLLRACAGLLPVCAGDAEVLGVDLTVDCRAVRRRVGLLGHATALYDDLTVEDNVSFAVRAAGGRRQEVGPALQRLGLDGRLRHVPVARLSAGQRRRTALAAIVARRPELWLLDEPHAGLDAAHRDLLDEMVREAAAAGATVLFASHEADRAVALARRTVTVAGGAVVGDGAVSPSNAGAVPALPVDAPAPPVDGPVPPVDGPAPPVDAPAGVSAGSHLGPPGAAYVA